MRPVISFFDSMSGRIFIILFAGLMLAGALGMKVSSLQRAGALEQLHAQRAADRVVAFLAMDKRGLGEQVPGIRLAIQEPAHGARDKMLSQALNARFRGATLAAAFDAPLSACFPDVPERGGPPGRNSYWRMRPPSCWVVHIEREQTSSFWATVETPMTIVNSPAVFDPLFVVVFLIGAVLLSLLVSRLTAAPLHKLSKSLARLGDDFEGAALEVSGPAEVRAAAMALNGMQKKIGSHIAERTHMLSAIAHDLQTPLTRMRLRLDHLERGATYEKLLNDTEEMSQLVREGLDLIHDTACEEESVLLDVDSLVDSLVQDANELGAEIEITGHSRRDAFVKPLALRRCISNLLNNAIHYACDIEIGTFVTRDDRIMIRILDRGPGIPEQHLKAVFEPFFRVQSANEPHRGGTGLGLAIANRFALLNESSLTISNRVSGGLCAEIILAKG